MKFKAVNFLYDAFAEIPFKLVKKIRDIFVLDKS